MVKESGNIGSRNHTLQETALIHLNPPLDLSLSAHEKMLPDAYLRAGLSRRSGFMRGEWAVFYFFEKLDWNIYLFFVFFSDIFSHVFFLCCFFF